MTCSDKLISLSALLSFFLIITVCGQEPDNVAVVEGIPVNTADEKISQAQDRIDLDFGIDEAEDQIAEESQITQQIFAQERDGGGHGHHGGGHGHHAEHGPIAVAVPAPNGYDTPQAPPAPAPIAQGSSPAGQIDSYGAPLAPVVDSYGAPQAPPQTQYNPPPQPQPQPQPSGPIPVPLPVPVQPGSIVIPGGPPPQNNYRPPPQKKPQYKPQPPKKPQYRPPPPPQRRPLPPKKPQYKPRPAPQKPKYKPKPAPQKKPVYQKAPPQKPQYRPPPQKQVYKPRPTPPPPKYQPRPQPPKQAYQPKPAYKPQPKPQPQPRPLPPKQEYRPQPVKQVYSPQPQAPSNPAPTYVQPTKADDPWPQAQPDMPKITSLDVQCEKNLMKVSIKFDKPFYGIIFSKGFYSDVNCVHLPAGVGRSDAQFDIAINSCGTSGNTENGLYGYGADSGSGTFFENTIVVQYDPQVQEVWDQARKLRCTWHDQYEKSVTFRPFPVDMLDVVRADFAGDNVGCWMQIQVGKGPWASEVSGLVKIGQTMTMVLAIKDDEQKFDMLVRNCMAHDGKRAPIQLVDQKGCVTRPKLMSKFTKIKNFGASASVLSYAHFQAFKFPDSMEVHFQCTIQICRYQCPDQCSSQAVTQPSYPAKSTAAEAYGAPQAPAQSSYDSPQAPPAETYGGPSRTKRSAGNSLYGYRLRRDTSEEEADDLGDIGVEKVIHVVSSGDLTFDIKEGGNDTVVDVYPAVAQSLHEEQGYICMSTPAFTATLIILLAILIISCLLSAFLCLRHRSYYGETSLIAAFTNPVFAHKKGHF